MKEGVHKGMCKDNYPMVFGINVRIDKGWYSS